MGGSLECAQLLLEAGADRNATDRGGAVPWAHVPEAAGKLRALLEPAGPAQKLPRATQAYVNGVTAEQQTPDQAFAVSVSAQIVANIALDCTGGLRPGKIQNPMARWMTP